MRVIRGLLLMLVSMILTIGLLLGVARLPGAERMQATLNTAADFWVSDSFDVALTRELNNLMDASRAPMLHQLAMLQIAEKARVARLQAIARAHQKGWQVPLPSAAYRGDFTFVKPKEQYLSSQAAQTRTEKSDELLTVTLVTFGFAILWILLVRRL